MKTKTENQPAPETSMLKAPDHPANDWHKGHGEIDPTEAMMIDIQAEQKAGPHPSRNKSR